MVPTKTEHARKHLVGLLVALSALSCADGGSKSAPLSPLIESATSTSAVARANTDRATLVEFYRATGGDDWTRSDGWLSEVPISSWYGVTVDGDRVVGLELSRNNLKGRLPAALGQLAGLRRLDLPYNKLWGRIPPGFGQLAELEYLDLGVNELTGSLPPELAKLSRLRVLSLISSGNSGPIPAWLGDLAELRWLELGENPMGGRIPPELGKLSNLEILYLANAGLSGPIPPEPSNRQ